MRVVHFTDLHILRPAHGAQLLGKRLLGTVNLEIFGRRSHFSESSVQALVRDVAALRPDLLVCTGDLTAMGLPDEFQAARDLLQPLTQRFPMVLIPGNHDTYTRRAAREHRIEGLFGSFTGGGRYPAVRRVADLVFIGLDPCRFHPLTASGRLPDQQLDALRRILTPDAFPDAAVILLIHYPLVDRHGAPYGPFTRNLENASELLEVLSKGRLPDLILHGHEHHGFRSEVEIGQTRVPIIDPGAGGRSFHSRRSACFNLYDLDRTGLVALERHVYDGERFVSEAGGAYASGR